MILKVFLYTIAFITVMIILYVTGMRDTFNTAAAGAVGAASVMLFMAIIYLLKMLWLKFRQKLKK